MIATPRVSVVLATYNAAEALEECIHSVVQQSHSNWELLIADGGSTDGTVDLIKRYESHIVWWQSCRDKGIYDAWNQALLHAHGDYVCFIGADDRLADPETLCAMADALGSKRPDVVSAKGQLIDNEDHPILTFGEAWDYKALRRHIRICHPGTWFKRDLFGIYGFFNLHYRIVADYEWLLRLPESTSAHFINRTIIRIGNGGVSRTQVWRRLRERREAQANCPRIGPSLAYLYWLDKLWRWPIARFLGLQH